MRTLLFLLLALSLQAAPTIVGGRSMLPTLPPGTVVQTESVPFQDLKVGDIVIFKRPEDAHPVIHRITYKSLNYLITKGDNNLRHDGFVLSKFVIARAVVQPPQ